MSPHGPLEKWPYQGVNDLYQHAFISAKIKYSQSSADVRTEANLRTSVATSGTLEYSKIAPAEAQAAYRLARSGVRRLLKR